MRSAAAARDLERFGDELKKALDVPTDIDKVEIEPTRSRFLVATVVVAASLAAGLLLGWLIWG